MKLFVGVDIGSTTAKCVIVDENDKMLVFSHIPTEYDRNVSGEKILKIALDEIGTSESDIAYLVSTGYGRKSFERADLNIPEIIAHGKPLHAFPFIVGDEDDLDAGIPDPADKGDRLCVWKGLIMRGQSIVDIAHEHADPMPLEPLQIQRTVAFHIIIRGKQLHVASSSHRRHYNTECARMEKLFTA